MTTRPYSEYPVLVVDDHLLSRKLISQQLLTLGFTDISTAANGAEALQIMEGKKFKLVIFDWVMPVMDGLEFIKNCMRRDDLKHCGFLMISSESEPGNVQNMLKSGATSFLTKPVFKDDLRTHIDKVINWIEEKERV